VLEAALGGFGVGHGYRVHRQADGVQGGLRPRLDHDLYTIVNFHQRSQAAQAPGMTPFRYRESVGSQRRKKPIAVLGTLGTMAAIWWFALRPRLGKRR
jgi:hypothetical protein